MWGVVKSYKVFHNYSTARQTHPQKVVENEGALLRVAVIAPTTPKIVIRGSYFSFFQCGGGGVPPSLTLQTFKSTLRSLHL